MIRRALHLLLALALAVTPVAAAQTTDFAKLVDRLSEPGGQFDSDNLVSNETAYLHVMPGLRAAGIHGGAYLGVGPEQNFSYIAEVQPDIAILIDIRRDNQVLHLLFKAMFETSRNRLEYLCLLFGRPVPSNVDAWTGRDLDSLLAYVDRTPPDSALHARTHESLMRRVESYGVPLTEQDRASLRRFHDEFTYAGLNLTFTTLRGGMGGGGRFYPDMRRLYTETERDSTRSGYLTSEDRWRRVQAMQRANLVVPVTGDLSGPLAMKAIGTWLRETHRDVSVFYVSNVEMYLMRAGSFPAFAANVRALPAAANGVIIRSWFNRGRFSPTGAPMTGDHFSIQMLQPISRFVTMTEHPDTLSYWTLVTDTSAVRPR